MIDEYMYSMFEIKYITVVALEQNSVLGKKQELNKISFKLIQI